MDEPLVRPMQVGDIFDRTFRLFGLLFRQNFFIVLIFLAGPCFLFAWSMNYFYRLVADMAAAGDKFTLNGFITIFGGMAVVGLGILTVTVGQTGAQIGITQLVCSAVERRTRTWNDAVDAGFSLRLLKAIGVQIILGLVIAGSVAATMAASVLFAALSPVLFVLLLPMMISAGCFAAFFWIRWSMAVTVIAWENRGVRESLGRSKYLIERNWWRVFGILLVFSLIVQFGSMLIMTPVAFITMWGYLKEMFSLAAGGRESASRFAPQIIQGIATGIGICIAIAMFIETLVKPIYTSLLYLDLRARQGEFAVIPPLPPEPAPAATASPIS